MSEDVLEREESLNIESGSSTDTTEVENIVTKLENMAIDAIERSDEERIEMINNADVSEIPQEINQATGMFRNEDPNGVVPLNDIEDINNPGVEIKEVIYEDRERPELKGTVNVDNMINEEQYDGEPYGQPASSGISGDISGRVENVDSEEERCYIGEDGVSSCDCEECSDDEEEYPLEENEDADEEVEEKEDDNVGKIADDINRVSAQESEEEEVMETPEELENEEVVGEAEDTEGDDTTPETVEEVEEEVETEEVEEAAEEEVSEEVETQDAVDAGEETAEVEVDTCYTGEVNKELTGELREEVEAIELGDNANTKMFDDVSFMKDPEHEVVEGTDLEVAQAAADNVVDGVGLQETYEGENIAETGTSETITSSDDLVPGAEEAVEEEKIEEAAATESLRDYDMSRKYTTRNVMSNFWNRK